MRGKVYLTHWNFLSVKMYNCEGRLKCSACFRFERTKETSVCSQCCLKSCVCCFYGLEKFIRYMNHNAYTVVAIEGTHFCNAARIVSKNLVF